MNAKKMHELKEMLCKELETIINKGNITRSDLEPIEYLTGSIKNLMRINEMEEGGYSYGMGNWNANGSYSNGSNGYSNEGYSNNRGYSMNGNYNGSYNGYGDNENTMSGRMHYVRGHYSRDGGEMLTSRIEEMINDNRLSTDEKSTLRRALDILDK